jgi:hypothetical protein
MRGAGRLDVARACQGPDARATRRDRQETGIHLETARQIQLWAVVSLGSGMRWHRSSLATGLWRLSSHEMYGHLPTNQSCTPKPFHSCTPKPLPLAHLIPASTGRYSGTRDRCRPLLSGAVCFSPASQTRLAAAFCHVTKAASFAQARNQSASFDPVAARCDACVARRGDSCSRNPLSLSCEI